MMQNIIHRTVLLASLFVIVVGQDLVSVDRPENCNKDNILSVVQEALNRLLPEYNSKINELRQQVVNLQDQNEKLLIKTKNLEEDVKKIGEESNSKGKSCPCHRTMFNNSCYQSVKTPMSWDNAKNSCSSMCPERNSRLVEINTEQENGFLTKLLDNSFWTGGHDQDHEGHFTWSSNNQSYTYRNWGPGQPRSGSYEYGAEENCMSVVNGMWHDYPCSSKFRFICEMET